jgi:hypothetical protein
MGVEGPRDPGDLGALPLGILVWKKLIRAILIKNSQIAVLCRLVVSLVRPVQALSIQKQANM